MGGKKILIAGKHPDTRLEELEHLLGGAKVPDYKEEVKQIELTDQECSIIVNALNAYWNEAHLQVQEGKVLMSNGDKRPIGDIEKKQQQWVVEHAKPLLEKFNNL